MAEKIVQFTRAVRKGSRILVALYGHSSSGKTYSALLLARGIAGPKGRVGLLDTESGRANLYAHVGAPWDHADLTPPFTPERYVEAIKAAEEEKFDVLVIDSGSHEWDGLGGTLETADDGRTSDGRPLKGLAKWKGPKARHSRFMNNLLQVRVPLIICLRAKNKVSQRGNDIIDEGLKPIQAANFIFDMTVQLQMHHEPERRAHYTVEKVPEDLIGAFPVGKRITVETGAMVRQWLDGAAPADAALDALKAEAMEAAERGVEALRAFWERIGKQGRGRLADQLGNLKSVAIEADRENIEDDGRPTFRPAGSTAERDIPFGDDPPIKSSAEAHSDAGSPTIPGAGAAAEPPAHQPTQPAPAEPNSAAMTDFIVPLETGADGKPDFGGWAEGYGDMVNGAGSAAELDLIEKANAATAAGAPKLARDRAAILINKRRAQLKAA